MDLKKNKKLKKKYNSFKIEHKKYVGYHLYRSADRNAPFSEWERLTEKPLTENFTDDYKENAGKRYYYKMTDVEFDGKESKPYTPKIFGLRDGRKFEVTPENSIMGLNIYWSLDPDLPLDRWTLLNEKPFEEENPTFQCPVKEPFYMYGKYVNDLGNEFGKPSPVQRVVPKP